MKQDDEIAVKVEALGKVYRIGLKEELHDSFGAALLDFIRTPLKNFRKYRSLYKFDDLRGKNGDDDENSNGDVVWAVRDVSFEVKKGEVLGIIGRNGAGKSTLLKILSRITDPSRGRAEIRGRVSSLLEVGTGFHQELTGRENVYLNGVILGMRKTEIKRKFDEIVAFSGVERFIDTPMKRYSSGMQVRLAFSVAAHLEPEIMIIDEVLAVGDVEFQKKCLNKMEESSQSGRTVLFVSHNMPAITRLCPRAILLDNGRVIADGPSHEVVRAYLDTGTGTTASKEWPDISKAPGDEVVRLRAVRVRGENGITSSGVMDIRHPIGLEMEYDVLQPGFVFLPYFRVWNQDGIELFDTIDVDPDWRGRAREAGRYVSTAWIPGNYLAEGTIFLMPSMRTLRPMVRRLRKVDKIAFQVVDSMGEDSARGDHASKIGGVVRPMLKWETVVL
jgi:lipopolysaccharide transport system ATP-binding protein